MKILLMSTVFLSLTAFAKNRPYTEVVAELIPQGCTQQKENLYLSKEQRSKIERMSEARLYGGLALRYITKCPGGKTYYHYVD